MCSGRSLGWESLLELYLRHSVRHAILTTTRSVLLYYYTAIDCPFYDETTLFTIISGTSYVRSVSSDASSMI